MNIIEHNLDEKIQKVSDRTAQDASSASPPAGEMHPQGDYLGSFISPYDWEKRILKLGFDREERYIARWFLLGFFASALVNLGSRKDEKLRLAEIYGEKSEVLGKKAT